MSFYTDSLDCPVNFDNFTNPYAPNYIGHNTHLQPTYAQRQPILNKQHQPAFRGRNNKSFNTTTPNYGPTLQKTQKAADLAFNSHSVKLPSAAPKSRCPSAKKENCSFSSSSAVKNFPDAHILIMKKEEKPLTQQKEIDQEIDPTIVNELGETNLHIAAQNGDLKTIKKLLKANANISAVTLEGKTPINYAIYSYIKYINENTLKVIQLLVKHGGYDGASRETDKTKELLLKEIFVLQNDVLIPHPHVIDILIRAGADKKAMKALVDETYYNSKMDQELWSHYSPVDKMLTDSSATASLKRRSLYDELILHKHFEKDVDTGPNIHNHDLHTKQNYSSDSSSVLINPLEEHVSTKKKGRIKKKPIDLNAQSDRGETLLHKAVSKGDLNKVKDFVKSGANIHAFTFGYKTPMSYALNNYKQNPTENNLNIVRFLVKHGGYSATQDNEKAQFAKNALNNEIFVPKNGKLIPHSYNIEILIMAGADMKAMKKLVDDNYNKAGKKKIDDSHLWPYYNQACRNLGVSLETVSDDTSPLHEEIKLPSNLSTIPPRKTVDTGLTSHNSDLVREQQSRKEAAVALTHS